MGNGDDGHDIHLKKMEIKYGQLCIKKFNIGHTILEETRTSHITVAVEAKLRRAMRWAYHEGSVAVINTNDRFFFAGDLDVVLALISEEVMGPRSRHDWLWRETYVDGSDGLGGRDGEEVIVLRGFYSDGL